VGKNNLPKINTQRYPAATQTRELLITDSMLYRVGHRVKSKKIIILCAGLLEFAYDKVMLEDVKDVTFFPSRETRSYDAFIAISSSASAAAACGGPSEAISILRLELATGQLDTVHGNDRCRPTDTPDNSPVLTLLLGACFRPASNAQRSL